MTMVGSLTPALRPDLKPTRTSVMARMKIVMASSMRITARTKPNVASEAARPAVVRFAKRALSSIPVVPEPPLIKTQPVTEMIRIVMGRWMRALSSFLRHAAKAFVRLKVGKGAWEVASLMIADLVAQR